MITIRRFPVELACWVAALGCLAVTNPVASHFTLCPLSNLGFTWCPGCGLGHSVSALLHGNIQSSLQYHWFGIPATGILAYRIWHLSKSFFQSLNLKTNYES